MNVLELRGIHAAYGKVEVLHGIDLHVGAGELVALLGPNGAGKTTTLNVACGLHHPTAGDVWMAGRPVTFAPAEELARRGVCTIPERRGVFPNLSVRDNLRMVTHAGVDAAEVEEVTFARFPNLAARAGQAAGTLSGGEQQMLAMARALATRPALLLLDEPSMGLAPRVVRQLYDLVASFTAEGTSILVVEQFAHTALSVAHRAVVLQSGRVAVAGRPDEVASQLSAAYLGG